MHRNGKIKTIDELAEVLASRRAKGKIVHCHGVFDLLHIGHIRHLEEARGLGDVLVVTVTPDRHVNKGPDRPVFNEDLRVEALAGLRCVDFVALNRWPMAKEAIEALRPDIFVKGGDYREPARDRTGGITVEEEAVNAVGGRLVLTESANFSSSNLINRHLTGERDGIARFLDAFAARHPADSVARALESCRDLKVLATGETIIDEYHYCEALGKSSKEPMLAVLHAATEKFAGGILAVANHAAAFCGQVCVVTQLGAKKPQEEFLRSKLRRGIDAEFLPRAGAPTIVKRRFIESDFFTKLLEVYEMSGPSEPAEEKSDEEALCAALRRRLPDQDLAIVVDYGHGMIGEKVVEILCCESRFLALDVQANAGNYGYSTVSKFPRADFLCLTEKELRLEARDRRGDLRPIVERVARRLRCPRVVVTRGRNGCIAFGESEGFFEVPAFASRVVDRMGAGDTVLAVAAPCAARGAPMDVVGFIANAAGAQAVATVGNRRPVERIALLRHVECLLK